MEVVLFVVVLVMWFVFAFLGLWIASTKGRSEGEGWVLGFLFGPLGCLIEALLPNQGPAPAPVVTISHEEFARREAAQKARQAKHDAALAAARDAAIERDAEMRRQAWAWFFRVVVRFGWFHALPEIAQPIVAGLAIALPVVGVIIGLFRM